MTTANKITILRILLIPFFIAQVLYFIETGREEYRWLAEHGAGLRIHDIPSLCQPLSMQTKILSNGRLGLYNTERFVSTYGNDTRLERSLFDPSDAFLKAKAYKEKTRNLDANDTHKVFPIDVKLIGYDDLETGKTIQKTQLCMLDRKSTRLNSSH